MKLHRTELPYDPTPRAVAQDSGLSFGALGVWVWARSLPDGAELSVEHVERAHRGLGADRATKAVRELRERDLWHTLTFRTRAGLTSRVVVPPEPWSRAEVAAALGLDVEQLVDGPSDRRHLQPVSAGQADTRISDRHSSDAQSSEGQPAEGQRPGGESSEQTRKNYPPTPRAAGGSNCSNGHTAPTRGCCTPRALREAATAARKAEREQLARARDEQRRAEAVAAEARRAAAAPPEWEQLRATLGGLRRKGAVPDGTLGAIGETLGGAG